MPTPEDQDAFRRQFDADWARAMEGVMDAEPPYAEIIENPTLDPSTLPKVVGRGGHAGNPPLYGLDPSYVSPDELPPESDEIVAHHELSGFLARHEWLYVTSSNVKAIQYYHEEQLLYIEYLSGAIYGYTGVTMDEALDFATAPSKGRWRHQHLPVSRNNYFVVSVGMTPEEKLPKHARGKSRFTSQGKAPRLPKSYGLRGSHPGPVGA